MAIASPLLGQSSIKGRTKHASHAANVKPNVILLAEMARLVLDAAGNSENASSVPKELHRSEGESTTTTTRGRVLGGHHLVIILLYTGLYLATLRRKRGRKKLPPGKPSMSLVPTAVHRLGRMVHLFVREKRGFRILLGR